MSSPNSQETLCRLARFKVLEHARPDDPNVYPERRLFSSTSLTVLLTQETIRSILACRCASCVRHVSSLRNETSKSSSPERAERQAGIVRAKYTILFGLLVYIEFPQLIEAFIRCKFDDIQLRSGARVTKPEHICKSSWPFEEECLPGESRRFADSFNSRRHQFTAPFLQEGTYMEFKVSTLLPFVNERPIGRRSESGNSTIQEGGNGRVFGFEIIEGYHHFPSHPNIHRFARKELRDVEEGLFRREEQNLSLIRALGDRHLVNLIMAYKHGDVYNLVFPCGRQNLGQYLRRSDTPWREMALPQIRDCGLWRQMLGIARALERVANYDPKKTGMPQLYGYHLDLKPTNILVAENGDWQIMDFGQSRFRRVSAGITNITPRPGTLTYAPPESETEARPNRKYDVWSMGCIFTEVLAFAVGGPKEVKEFDEQRKNYDERLRYTSDRYFITSGSDRKRFILKPQVSYLLDKLSSKAMHSDEQSRTFVRSIVDLIKEMLEVEVSDRLDSSKVSLKLSKILNNHKQLRNEDHGEMMYHSVGGIPYSHQEEFRVGSKELAEIELLEIFARGFWTEGQIRLLENDKDYLTAVTFDNTECARSPIGSRHSSRLICNYSLRGSNGDPSLSQTISLMDSQDDDLRAMRLARLNFRNDRDMLVFQSVVLGQDIKNNFSLGTVAFEKQIVLSGGRYRRKTTTSQRVTAGRPPLLQIWSERVFRSYTASVPKPPEDADVPRCFQAYLYRGAAPRRLVFYLDIGVLMVRLAKNVRIEKVDSKSSSRSKAKINELRLIPTDSSRDRTFLASLLPFIDDDVTASFPLSRRELAKLEEAHAFECVVLELTFRDEVECKAFRRDYQVLKQQARVDWTEMEQTRRQMGEYIGYGPA